jgi:histidinol-phosphate aminotransferase
MHHHRSMHAMNPTNSTNRNDMAEPRLRTALDGIPSYKAGRRPPAHPGRRSYSCPATRTHHEPLPEILAAIEAALPQIHRYPDYASTALVDAIAVRFDVPAEQVAVGTGSVGMLQQVFQVTCGPGDGVVFGWRSFEAYPIMAQIVGATAQRVDLDADDRHDLDAMARAIDEASPPGPGLQPEQPDRHRGGRGAAGWTPWTRVPSDVLIVLDEAYCEFVDPDRVPDGLRWQRQHGDVRGAAHFSKAHGLAALRVGFCRCPRSRWPMPCARCRPSLRGLPPWPRRRAWRPCTTREP